MAVIHRRRGGDRERFVLARAFAIALITWIVVAVALFRHVPTLHARYLEALAPALAAAIGYGAAMLAGLTTWRGALGTPSVLAITIALGGICAYTLGLPPWPRAWAGVAITVAAVGGALLARSSGATGHVARWLTAGLIVTCALLFPIHESLSLITTRANDSLGLKTSAMSVQSALWRYLEPRTKGLKYELAVDEPLALAPLLIHDQRPILPLTSFHGLPAIGLGELQAAVRSGAVRYGLVDHYTCGPRNRTWAACAPATLWIRQTGLDVSAAVGLVGPSRLYLMSPY